jgi:isopentenyl diphosphate isomerase/L-lactate dehydrogenase-like FMN-dependent dehydrogenase
VVSHEDMRELARATLPRALFEYVDGGAEDEVTLRRNVAAFAEVMLKPRMGDWHPQIGLATSVLGRHIDLPILTAPCGGMRLIHPHGDIGVARAAAEAGTIFICSSASGHTLEEVASVGGPKWFQVYRMTGRQLVERLVERAKEAGYEALVMTIDTQVSGLRERDARNGFALARRPGLREMVRLAPQVALRPGWAYRFVRAGMPYSLANTADPTIGQAALPVTEMGRVKAGSNSPTWEDIAWARASWDGPIVIKGVLSVEDARRACDAGAQAIVVSNHGGRQLDGAQATAAVLPAIAAAVGHQVEVLVDSGIRRGSDVVKALAMGAKAVLLGRPAVFGLAVAGTAGVTYIFELLKVDLVRTLRLMGCPGVQDLNPDWLVGLTRGTRP